MSQLEPSPTAPDARRTRAQPDAIPFLAILAVTLAMVLLTSAEGAIARSLRGDEIGWSMLLAGRLLDWLTCAILVPPLYWLTVRFPLGRRPWTMAVGLHLLATSAAAALKFPLWVPLRRAINPGYDATIAEALGMDFLGQLMFFWAVLGILHAHFFCREAQHVRPSAEAAPGAPAQPRRDARLAVDDGKGIRFIQPADIEWIEAQGNYSRVHCAQGRFLVRQTMRALSDRLGAEDFVRVHRSAIVNLSRLSSIDSNGDGRYRLTLESGAIILSSRSLSARLLKRID